MLSARKALALCSVVSATLAENVGILGCADLDCPTKGDTAHSEEDTIRGLSWAQGTAEHGENGRRTFEASFLLGMPSCFDRNGTRACPTLFRNVAGANADTDNTCSVMETAGVGTLKEHARNLRLQDGDGSCERLQEDLWDNLDSEYREAAGKNSDRWSDLTVKRSIQPYSQLSNSSSNSWPVLTGIAIWPSSDTEREPPGPIVDWMEDATPVLAVFYGGVVSERSDDEEPRVQMTCLRAIDSSTVAEENESEGGAEIVRLPGTGAALSTAMAVVVLTLISAWA
ncbi:hypothetical protein DL768_006253 [Monosporascus sp. mg162]|nr:hypothetical protein DL768_006253 [Monosporascus sp. mg162]